MLHHLAYISEFTELCIAESRRALKKRQIPRNREFLQYIAKSADFFRYFQWTEKILIFHKSFQ